MAPIINGSIPKEVQDVLSTFLIPHERLIRIAEDMQAEFTIGLESANSGRSSIAMLPSYVPALPDGTGWDLSRAVKSGISRDGQVRRHRPQREEPPNPIAHSERPRQGAQCGDQQLHCVECGDEGHGRAG